MPSELLQALFKMKVPIVLITPDMIEGMEEDEFGESELLKAMQDKEGVQRMNVVPYTA